MFDNSLSHSDGTNDNKQEAKTKSVRIVKLKKENTYFLLLKQKTKQNEKQTKEQQQQLRLLRGESYVVILNKQRTGC